MNDNKKLIYLAAPYSDKDPWIMENRFQLINKAASVLMSRGVYVFSPISHTHPIAVASNGDLPRGWEFWEEYDKLMIRNCSEMYVLCLDGWEASIGVKAEMKIAKELNINITYIYYDELIYSTITSPNKEIDDNNKKSLDNNYENDLKLIAFVLYLESWRYDMDEKIVDMISDGDNKSKRWKKHWLPHKNDDHFGDCTNAPISCHRCIMDELFKDAKTILECYNNSSS